MVLLGTQWQLRRTNKGVDKGNGGECDNPANPNRQIRIRPEVTSKKELEYLIHEMLHACHWEWDEPHVYQMAKDMAEVLWRCGYRKLPELDEFLQLAHGNASD